jgi:murein DD-endopeptidase MepM/ murein hydrolase activator NlpD
VGAEGAPRYLSFLTPRDTLVRIEPVGDGFRVAYESLQLDTRVVVKSGTVRTSLFEATDSAGVPDRVASQLADIFGGDIDFHRDLRKGDHFSVVYELREFDGRPVRAGRVLAAEFVNNGRAYRAIHFGSGYYTPQGKNLRKAFLRSPLEFSRISSRFGMRLHPFLQSWRAHKGIDYAAPIGTRVRAVADAVVEYAGPKGGYGNVVILRHQGQYSTVYAHLSRIAVHRGARVAQNDTIGFVGQTGWATGPHLHYEFRVAGQARNPFAVALPAALPLPETQMAAFRAQATAMASDLDLLESSSLALLD